MKTPDPYNLNRFLAAQHNDYAVALEELVRGRKESHWIWYIFPQVAGLGSSSMAVEYAIKSREEGVAYLVHPLLGSRLRECTMAILQHRDKRVDQIMDYPDDLKFNSSMTLFSAISEAPNCFHDALEFFFDGQRDQKTVEFLRAYPDSGRFVHTSESKAETNQSLNLNIHTASPRR